MGIEISQQVASFAKILGCEVKFLAGASKLELIPNYPFNEIAFIGRSNVGKSSLINAVFNRKSLARTSKMPGCTRQINLFLSNNKLVVSDLPGYGFARLNKKLFAHLNELIPEYLVSRDRLKMIFILVDSRHEFKNSDREAIAFMLRESLNFSVIFTKSEKSSQKKIEILEQSVAEFIQQEIFVLTQNNRQEAKDLQQLCKFRLAVSSFAKKNLANLRNIIAMQALIE